MARAQKTAERKRKSNAFREFVRDFARISDIYSPTPSSIFDCVSKAHLSEKHAVSTLLSRKELFREDPQAGIPEELSDKAISTHFANAASLFATAGTDCVLTSDLPRGFKYFRKAAVHCRHALELQSPCDDALLQKSLEYKQKAVMVRQELARRTVLRRKLSLGFLKRRR